MMLLRCAIALALLPFPALAQEDSADIPNAEQAHATVPVVLETTMGNIVIALETERAPITASNFLRYVERNRLNGTVFYRAMQVDWGTQPNGLLQGGTQWDQDRILEPIAHETTTETGLFHTRGAVSMARLEPGTATGDFSIMLQEMPSLDAQPDLPDPSQRPGFAVFGYVVEGMDVVEAIHATPTDPDKGEGFMRGQMLADPVVIVDARRIEPQAD